MNGTFLPSLHRTLAQLGHAVLLGSFVGIVAGCVEFVLLMRADALAADPATAYWQIVIPYFIVGLAGGLLLGAGLHLTLGGRDSRAYLARLYSALLPLVVLAYLGTWATYGLGPPVLRLSVLAAYAGSAALAALFGLVVHRLVRGGVPNGSAVGGPPAVDLGRRKLTIALGAGVVLAPIATRAFWVRPQAAPPTAVPDAWGSADAKKRPNIVLILIDTLRADHLPFHGYSRATAPNLAALARRGATFNHMYAQSSFTRPSVATLLTSLYPAVHGTHRDHDFLPEALTTLPEVMRNGGYETFAISANVNVSPVFGYSQGFNDFRVWKSEAALRLTMLGRAAEDALGTARLGRLLGEHRDIVPTADAITDVALEWAARNARRPFFLYVHYIDPHEPYRPPSPYDRSFSFERDPGRREGQIDPLSLLASGKDPVQVAKILDQYDGEILYADGHMGRLLRGLEARGFLDDTVIMVTSDHGEEFYEHGQDSHGRSVYEEVMRVPFVASWPGRIPEGSRYEHRAGLIDVMPTLIEVAGLEAPAGLQGMSFARQLREPALAMPEREFFAQVVQKPFAMEMVRSGPLKLVRHLRGARAGQEELYDLESDPLERTDLAARVPVQAATLRRDLDAFNRVAAQAARGIEPGRTAKVDRDTERALRSLGYIK